MGIFGFWTERDWSQKSYYGNNTKGLSDGCNCVLVPSKSYSSCKRIQVVSEFKLYVENKSIRQLFWLLVVIPSDQQWCL